MQIPIKNKYLPFSLFTPVSYTHLDVYKRQDLEFPNDLLWELDKMEFFIPETGKTVTAKKRPVVIITSNAEKELPDAFLRRCIFHYIDFPDAELMEKIVRSHFDLSLIHIWID